MRTSTLTLALPDELYLRLERAATATRQSIEEVVLHALRLGSPPAWDDVPPEHQIDLAALEKLVKRGQIKKRERVVVVSTASGLKFTEFKVRYHDKAIPGVSAEHANPPVELPADYDRVRAALDAHTAANAQR